MDGQRVPERSWERSLLRSSQVHKGVVEGYSEVLEGSSQVYMGVVGGYSEVLESGS